MHSDQKSRAAKLIGGRLPERLRSATFAMLGLTALAGLCMVALFARADYPVLSMGPLPNGPVGGLGVNPGMSLDLGGGPSDSEGFGGSGGGLASDDPARLAFAPEAGDGLLPGLIGGDAAADGIRAGLDALPAGSGVGGPVVWDGTGGGAGLAASLNTAQAAPALPEAVVIPVTGSKPSSGLYIRSSVVTTPGEDGQLGDKPVGVKPPKEEPTKETPKEEPPAEEPPVEEPPKEEPPVEEPPAEEPPVVPPVEPPMEEPPAEEPPAEEPPAEEPPVEEPPAEEPPAEEPPAEEPPAEEPAAETPAEEAPAEAPPAGE